MLKVPFKCWCFDAQVGAILNADRKMILCERATRSV